MNQLKKYNLNTRKTNRVCIVDTVFPLYLYLLISSIEEIEHTLFFFSEGIDSSIREHFHHVFFSKKRMENMSNLRRYFARIYLRFTAPLRWPVLKKSDLFVQDQLFHSMALIGNADYSLLEDGSANYTFKRITPRCGDQLRRFLFGSPTVGPFGDNPHAKELILTGLEETDFMKEKNVHIIDTIDLFKKSSDEKKYLILDVFNTTKEEIAILKKRKTVLFTQAFSEDGIISEEEKINLYKTILQEYDISQLVIKTHPRETTAYRKYFPDVFVFDKAIPTQLIDAFDVKYERVLTISSTAALSLPYPTELHWMGTDIDSRILKIYGNIQPKIKNFKV